ncbi:hypothetical protein Tco_0748843 [Tanacetum coccineum]|uniref:Uncharacterized protein n=1 Tax=Tanacetum coccineum TaxID=301880 RepID=A0ABQ4YZR1_9ASTR
MTTESSIFDAPNWDLPFELMCVQAIRHWCVLGGNVMRNDFRPIHFASKSLIHSATDLPPLVSLCKKGCQGEIASDGFYILQEFASKLLILKEVENSQSDICPDLEKPVMKTSMT